MSVLRANRSPIGLLKILLGACALVPLLLFALASLIDYRSAMSDARRGLTRMVEVAHQHAAKVFDSQSQVADRVNDLVRGMDVAAIRASEHALHEAFARIVVRLSEVQSVLLAAKDGAPLVSAGTYPVPTDVTVRDRDYFRGVMVDGKDPYVSSLQVGDVNRKLFFGVARPWLAADNSRAGVIDVAVQPSFFSDFYEALMAEGGGSDGSVVTLIRDDGQVLVRNPPFTGPPPVAPQNSAFFDAVRANPDQGIYESRSIIDAGAPARLFSYRRVQGYPVYVVAGRSRASIVAGWRRTMESDLIFGLPATIALLAVTWTALSRTRREQEALGVARQEIARREAAEAALLRAQRLEAVGQMTGGVAHDFNNLLTIILGSAEMLAKRPEDADRVRRFSEQILLAARRGGEVTHQLLAFSRRQIVHPQTVNLNRCIVEFKQLLDRAAREAVRVDLDLDPALRSVRLDPGHFEAAILNLVGNGRDAMPQGGRVVIQTRNVALRDHADLTAGFYVRVTVTDDGAGMDAATAARAFEPFFTTKETGAGTGLGLSQVYGFAKQAGGDARIVTAPGHGTTIELLLPTTDEPAEALRGVEPAQSTESGEAILVVEDEPELRAMTVDSLAELGYAPLAAPDAHAAMRVLAAPGRIDLLFSDVVMPGGVDGVQLAAQARKLRPGLLVLLTSGHAASSAADLALDLPMLRKPYDRAQLQAALQTVLRGETR